MHTTDGSLLRQLCINGGRDVHGTDCHQIFLPTKPCIPSYVIGRKVDFGIALGANAWNNSVLVNKYNCSISGGEPDVIGYDPATDEYLFVDCSPESPKGRRSLCYDRAALDARKEHKPKSSALDMAEELGIELLDEEMYRKLQELGEFDTKTSSWLLTPAPVRELGGALYGDRRYNRVFIYHNGAESYYASRGFRGLLRV